MPLNIAPVASLPGGRQGKVPVTAFEVFDFADSTWRKLPNIPSKRVFALYTHSDTHIYSIGGLKETSSEGFSDVTEVFDIEKGMSFLISVTLLRKKTCKREISISRGSYG